ncbi:MAG: hypothetical protein JNL30_18225 [Rubrivivax sp.]|nr:hypothetical protein [Rubrivivax sp.]
MQVQLPTPWMMDARAAGALMQVSGGGHARPAGRAAARYIIPSALGSQIDNGGQ